VAEPSGSRHRKQSLTVTPNPIRNPYNSPNPNPKAQP